MAERLSVKKGKISLGCRVKAPCGHDGVVIWVSSDGKSYAVQCLNAKEHIRVKNDWRGKVVTRIKPIYILEEKL